MLPRDCQHPWQTQVGQTTQDNCSRQQLAGPDCQKAGLCQPSHSSRRSGHQYACFIKNFTSDSCLHWSPWSYCCPETSAKQETAKKPCCVRQGPHPDRRLDCRKVAKNVFFRLIVSWAPSQAPPILLTILRGPSGPTVHPEDSQIWRWKDYGLGLHPIQKCQGDL